MLTVLVSAMLLLLIAIAYALFTMAARQRATSQWMITALRPTEYALPEAVEADKPRHRTIVDQLLAMTVQLESRIEQLDRKMAYLRNYVWEERDTRFLHDIRHPPTSVEWKRTFGPHEDPAEYGLWMRERDLTESFNREVARPVLRSRDEA